MASRESLDLYLREHNSAEINLMEKYPQIKRDPIKRGQEKTEEDKIIARKFGKEFFDGERKHGYGGFSYNSRFWTGVVQDMIGHYKLTNKSKLFDVGCAKGFMLYDFKQVLPVMLKILPSQ